MEHSKTKFHPLEHTVYRRTFYFWVVVLVLVGPSIGFLAAGLLYGTVSGRLEAIGQNLQAISSWVRSRMPWLSRRWVHGSSSSCASRSWSGASEHALRLALRGSVRHNCHSTQPVGMHVQQRHPLPLADVTSQP